MLFILMCKETKAYRIYATLSLFCPYLCSYLHFTSLFIHLSLNCCLQVHLYSIPGV